MFDDLETAEQRTEDAPANSENAPSSQLYRWAHFPAMLAFGILIILFHGRSWGWQIAIGGGYTVYVFFFALGSVLRGLDDFLGDPKVLRCTAKLLIPHAFFLTLILSGVSLWFHLKLMLPSWLTHEGRKESLWDLLGWLALAIAGIVQGSWMGGRLKRWLGKPED